MTDERQELNRMGAEIMGLLNVNLRECGDDVPFVIPVDTEECIGNLQWPYGLSIGQLVYFEHIRVSGKIWDPCSNLAQAWQVAKKVSTYLEVCSDRSRTRDEASLLVKKRWANGRAEGTGPESAALALMLAVREAREVGA